MKIAYLDCFAGASGDMLLGAIIDSGLSVDELKNELAKLHLTHFDLQYKKVVKKGIGGSQALVIIDQDHHHHHHRHLSNIVEIIENSDLTPSVKTNSIRIFNKLAEAEAKVHQTTIEKIHFHEVGAMDSIIDVVGTVAGLELLGIDTLYCSPLHVGTGFIKCAHGTLPVPAPATAELVRNLPIYSTGVEGELLTPTGAAILTTLSSGFGSMPAMTVDTWGYGAGSSEPAIPNLLRMAIGQAPTELDGYEMEQAAVVETNIDDMTPQIYDYLIERLLEQGVMDVFLTHAQMKKNRPGTLVTVVCKPEMIPQVSDFLMHETTTIGLRWRVENRIKTKRTIKEVSIPYGKVGIKVAGKGDQITNMAPEYEDCKRLALEKKVPLKDVIAAAKSAITANMSDLK
jgi:pyridinium-3,5-bisthiocarboxylic acid mononucleotide nickel chelatase